MNENQTSEEIFNHWVATTEKVSQSAGGTLARLSQLEELRHYIEATERALVIRARAEGVSWSDIGAQFGMSKQGAQNRFQA